MYTLTAKSLIFLMTYFIYILNTGCLVLLLPCLLPNLAFCYLKSLVLRTFKQFLLYES